MLGNPYVRLAFVILRPAIRPAILPFLYSKKVRWGGGGVVVWEVWGHLRVSWEDELGGKGRGGGSVVVTKREKEEL